MIIQPKETKDLWRIKGHETGWNVQHMYNDDWENIGPTFPDLPAAVAGFVAVVGRLLPSGPMGLVCQEFANSIDAITRSINQTYRATQDGDDMRELYHLLKRIDPEWDGKDMIAKANKALNHLHAYFTAR